jgi:hypothetical protein
MPRCSRVRLLASGDEGQFSGEAVRTSVLVLSVLTLRWRPFFVLHRHGRCEEPLQAG